MDALVSILTRKSRGGYAQRDIEVTADILDIGRGADSKVFLEDPRIPLHCARITSQPGGFFVESIGPLDIRLNGAPTTTARIKPGDKVAIGPYEIGVAEPPDGKDLAITVELLRPLGDDYAQLAERSRISLAEAAWSKRGLSWTLFVLGLVLFLALPVAAFMVPQVHDQTRSWPITADRSWLSGPISGNHKFFEADCKACHQKPFQQVADQACVECHGRIANHAKADRYHEVADAGQKCQSCHKEHNGKAQIILSDQRFCADCHGDLTARLPDTPFQNASDFGTDHPQFRPTVVVAHVSGEMQRLSLEKPETVKEDSGIRYPHDVHLKRTPAGAWRGMKELTCASCHVPEPGGVGMAPISQEEHCQECHQLRFEPLRPERTVPHGKPKEVQLIIKDFYAKVALEGGFEAPGAPAVVRRRVGSPMPADARADALAWAEERAKEAITGAFGKSLCGYCHVVTEDAGGVWDVVKPRIPDRWMPHGVFDHGAHRDVECADCHKAEASNSNKDVLLPGIATCRDCHGGERATAAIPSACVMCHAFHNPPHGPMYPEAAGKKPTLAGASGN
jgi:predicted CXXCH cytochrome family protein